MDQTCPNCQASVPEDAPFCPNCGMVLKVGGVWPPAPHGEALPPSPSPYKMWTKWPWLDFLLSFILVVGGLFVFVLPGVAAWIAFMSQPQYKYVWRGAMTVAIVLILIVLGAFVWCLVGGWKL